MPSLPPPSPLQLRLLSAVHTGDLRQMAANAAVYNDLSKNPAYGVAYAIDVANQLGWVAERALMAASADVKAAERAIRQEASKLVVWGGMG